MKVSKFRKIAFNELLTIYKTNNKPLDEKLFFLIGKLFLDIIPEFVIDKDYESMRFLMYLAEILFKLNPNSSVETKVYIQSVIKVHEIWDDENFWYGIIRCNLFLIRLH